MTLQPGPAEGKDATISSRFPSTPVYGGEYTEFNMLAWTNQGNIDTNRSLIDFNNTTLN